MKKRIAVFLCAVMMLSLAACANEQKDKDTSDQIETETQELQEKSEESPDADTGENDSSVSGDTQDAMDNNDDHTNISDDAEADTVPEIGVLVSGMRFTGLTQIENNNDFNGGYYYADQTEDGLTMIINSGFSNDFSAENETIEAYISRCIETISSQAYRDLEIQDTTMDSWPAYRLTWMADENGDARQWDALLVTTDLYTYIYAFDTAADHAGEMLDTWNDVLDGITLEFFSE